MSASQHSNLHTHTNTCIHYDTFMRTQTRSTVGLTHSLLFKFINLTAFETEPIFKHLIYSGGGEGSECIHMRICG